MNPQSTQAPYVAPQSLLYHYSGGYGQRLAAWASKRAISRGYSCVQSTVYVNMSRRIQCSAVRRYGRGGGGAGRDEEGREGEIKDEADSPARWSAAADKVHEEKETQTCAHTSSLQPVICNHSPALWYLNCNPQWHEARSILQGGLRPGEHITHKHTDLLEGNRARCWKRLVIIERENRRPPPPPPDCPLL